MLVFIDESGCLGFDWTKQKTSKYLVLTALVCNDSGSNRIFNSAVKRTLRRKINHKAKKRPKNEIKGSDTPHSTKLYFYQQLKSQVNWGIYSVTLNKQRVYNHLQEKHTKHKLYNYLVNFLIEKIPIPSDISDISIIIDKSKNPYQIRDLNKYILWNFENKVGINCNVHLYHPSSHEHAGLQAVDLFCWGIARNLEDDTAWYDVFKEKIEFNSMYLP